MNGCGYCGEQVSVVHRVVWDHVNKIVYHPRCYRVMEIRHETHPRSHLIEEGMGL